MSKFLDAIFFCASIVFNISVSVVYIAARLENMALLQVSGAIVIILMFPFATTFLGYVKEKEERKITIPHVVILFYLFLELLLDYVLIIPFREILVIHIPYIIVFYAAEFSMIGVSFNRNRKMGLVVTAAFCILLVCLIYSYTG